MYATRGRGTIDILDPRTGGLLDTWKPLHIATPGDFLSKAFEFMERKRPGVEVEKGNEAEKEAETEKGKGKGKGKAFEAMTEDEQLQYVLGQSMGDTVKNEREVSEVIDLVSDDEEVSASASAPASGASLLHLMRESCHLMSGHKLTILKALRVSRQ